MNKQKYFGIALALCLSAGAVMPLKADSAHPEKYDSALKLALVNARNGQPLSKSLGSSAQSNTSSINVLALTNDSGVEASKYVKGAGGKVNSRHGNILSLTIGADDLGGLTSLKSVKRLEAPKVMHKANDRTRSAQGIDIVSAIEKNPNYTGRGVIVGIIDTGIDTTLPAFTDENGHSRIMYFWDQQSEVKGRYPTVRTPEKETRTYEYGAEYTAADIDKQTADNPIYTDKESHGTHCAGIAGGRDGIYSGVAPEVQFICVAFPEDTADLNDGCGSGQTLDAYEYIISRAKEANLPLVISFSQGNDLGPHDGSTPFEQALQADVESPERNLIFCASANNANGDKTAAEFVLNPAETRTITVTQLNIADSSRDEMHENSIDIWSTGNTETDLHMKV